MDRARRRPDAIVFDLDGTLIDSRAAWRDGFAAPFARLAERYPALLTLGDSAHVHDHVFQPFLVEIWERVRGEWDPEYVREGWRMLLERHAAPDLAAADAAYEEYEATWPAMMLKNVLFPSYRRSGRQLTPPVR